MFCISGIIKVTLIRHGKTEGNLKRQYIGVTDQPLCSIGIDEIARLTSQGIYPQAELLFSSPLKRCIETAAIIYKDTSPLICNELSECDFGEFECKSYEDLKDNQNYIAWLDSNATIPFPSGESSAEFISRCQNGFDKAIEQAKDISTLSIICHGGTIMSILHGFSYPNQSFYFWQAENGNGYTFDYDTKLKRALNIKTIFVKGVVI